MVSRATRSTAVRLFTSAALLVVVGSLASSDYRDALSFTPSSPSDVADAGQPARPAQWGHTLELAVDGVLGGAPTAVAANDTHIFLATGWHVQAYNVSDGETFQPIGPPLRLPDRSTSMATAGEQVFVGTSDGSLVTVDAHDPADLEMTMILYLSFSESSRSVEALVPVGNTLYATTRDGQLHILGITPPSPPFLLSSVQAGGWAISLVVKDGTAYLADWGGMSIVDVSDRFQPVALSRFDRPAFSGGGDGRALAVVGDRAYVGTGTDLRVVDVSDPRRPRQVGSVDVSTDRLALVGERLYLLDLLNHHNGVRRRSDLYALDFREGDAPTPTLLDAFYTESPATALVGARWYLADRDVGLRALGLGVPLPEQPRDRVPAEHTTHVAAGESLLALAVRQPAEDPWAPGARDGWRLDFVPVTPDEPPKVLGSWPIEGRSAPVVSMALVDDTALALTTEALYVLDVATPSAPSLRTTVPDLDGARALYADADWVVVGHDPSSVDVFTWAPDGKPLLRATHDPGAAVLDMDRHGQHLLLATGGPLQILDLSDPAAPRPVNLATPVPPTDGLVRALVAGDRLAVVTRREQLGGLIEEFGLGIFDITDITAPRTVWIGDTRHVPRELARGLDGRLLAWGEPGTTLFGFDWSGEGAPKEIYAHAPPGGGTHDVIAAGDTLHVAVREGGYLRLKPRDLAETPATRTPHPTVTRPVPTPAPTWTTDPEAGHVAFLPWADRPPPPIDTLGFEDMYRGGGATYTVAAQGDLAYAITGRRLVVVDVSDGTQPQPVGEVALPGEVPVSGHAAPLALTVSADRVHLLHGRGMEVRDQLMPDDEMHLVAFDVADPTAPSVEAVTALPGYSVAMARVGQHLLVPIQRSPAFETYWTGMRVYDASPDTDLALVAEVEVPSFLTKLHVAGDRMMAAGVDVHAEFEQGHAVSLYDVADARRPRLLSEHPYEGGYSDLYGSALLEPLPSGDVLHLRHDGIGWVYPCCDGDTIAPAAEVRLPIDELDNFASGGVWFQGLWEMTLAGSVLYALDASFPEPALGVLDLADPSAPDVTAVVLLPGPIKPSHTHMPPLAATMTVTADHLVLSAGYAGGVRVVDVGDRTRPEQVGTWRDLGYAGHLAVADGALFTLAQDGLLSRWDVTDATDPRWVAEARTTWPVRYNALAATDQHVYVGGSSGLQAVRIGDDGSLTALPRIDDVKGWPVPAGGRVYVANANTGLHVLSLEDGGGRLVPLGIIAPVGEVEGVAVDRDLAYVASGEHGLAVLDVSDPNDAHELGYVDLPGVATEVALWDSRAFVQVVDPRWAYWRLDPDPARLFAIDVSDPRSPRVLGSIGLPYVRSWLWRQRGERLITLDHASSEDGLTIVDLGGERPRVIGQVPGEWAAADMGADVDQIYATDVLGQLVIGRLR